ncbi:hypothetical protein NEAUS05_1579 [Nematocida ausubeli]|nr:hypothetical protein NEAUS05_1579 [Nematocida ausubeli]
MRIILWLFTLASVAATTDQLNSRPSIQPRGRIDSLSSSYDGGETWSSMELPNFTSTDATDDDVSNSIFMDPANDSLYGKEIGIHWAGFDPERSRKAYLVEDCDDDLSNKERLRRAEQLLKDRAASAAATGRERPPKSKAKKAAASSDKKKESTVKASKETNSAQASKAQASKAQASKSQASKAQASKIQASKSQASKGQPSKAYDSWSEYSTPVDPNELSARLMALQEDTPSSKTYTAYSKPAPTMSYAKISKAPSASAVSVSTQTTSEYSASVPSSSAPMTTTSVYTAPTTTTSAYTAPISPSKAYSTSVYTAPTTTTSVYSTPLTTTSVYTAPTQTTSVPYGAGYSTAGYTAPVTTMPSQPRTLNTTPLLTTSGYTAPRTAPLSNPSQNQAQFQPSNRSAPVSQTRMSGAANNRNSFMPMNAADEEDEYTWDSVEQDYVPVFYSDSTDEVKPEMTPNERLMELLNDKSLLKLTNNSGFNPLSSRNSSLLDGVHGDIAVPIVDSNGFVTTLDSQPYFPAYSAPIGYVSDVYEDPNTESAILRNIIADIMMDSDSNALDDLLSETVRIREEALKDELTIKEGRYIGSFSFTFDGGPTENTLELLRILKKYKKVCGFYLDPFKITKESIPIVTQILKDGHIVGISIQSDVSLTDVTMEEARKKISTHVERYKKMIGVMPSSARLPRLGYYSDDIEYCMELGMYVCEPTYDVFDFADPEFISTLSDALTSEVYSPKTDSMIFVLRDKYSYTVSSIEKMIRLLISHGFKYMDYNLNTGLSSVATDSKKEGARRVARSKDKNLLSMNEEVDRPSTQKVVESIKQLARNEKKDSGIVISDTETSSSVISTGAGNIMLKVLCLGGVLFIVAFFI